MTRGSKPYLAVNYAQITGGWNWELRAPYYHTETMRAEYRTEFDAIDAVRQEWRDRHPDQPEPPLYIHRTYEERYGNRRIR